MSKQTKLDDNAEIYQRRKEQSENEKLREMSFKEKISYLSEYYKYYALAAITALAVLIYIIHEIANPDPKIRLYAAVINNPIEEAAVNKLTEDVFEYLQLDPKAEKVFFNTQFYFGASEQYTMSMKQVLTTHVAAHEVDLIIAPKSEFAEYAYYGYMAPLSDKLPADLYSSLADYFYISAQEDDPEEYVFGIDLSETDLLKSNADNTETDPYILGIVANAPNTENAVEFLRYLFR